MRNKRSKKIVIGGAIFIPILILLLMLVPVLAADVTPVLEINEYSETCRMFDSDDPPGLAIPEVITVTAKNVKLIETESANNITLYKCHSVNGAIPYDGPAIHYSSEDEQFDTPPNDYGCEIKLSNGGFIITNEWRQEISSNGNATYSCWYK